MADEVVLYTLGGTISIAGTVGDGSGVGLVARLGGADLASDVPGLAETGVPLKVEDIERVPSADLTFAQVLDLVQRASAAVRAGAGGIVVTQGTDTLEESAYLADLVWPHPEPLIFTGAMRNPTLAGPDGPANLLAAVLAAAEPKARGLGVLVAFNDELHAARWVRKAHATSTATFASPDAGPIGRLEEERVRILTVPPRRTPLPIPSAEQLDRVRVGLHTAVLDEQGDELDGIRERCQGLIVAGLGAGHVTRRLVPALTDLAARMPVVLTSRAGAGPVLRHTYSAPGSEIDLQNRGLINAGLLHPYKARVLLRLLLAAGATGEEIARAFAEHS
ncbi:asparaginase [Actinospica sp.]|jgi:L-asparaginase|uniref:asparaginase n=1 Tax=Actinospica sp. TaxID=1872142 RepID=UPI002C9C0E1B|nr:asparaginase [Actinospica sp.]HWG23349.1 asparaginase [Actinospica sp.]